jgi:hypothetical protein
MVWFGYVSPLPSGEEGGIISLVRIQLELLPSCLPACRPVLYSTYRLALLLPTQYFAVILTIGSVNP